MFCCLGLLAGFAVGSVLGGPLALIAPVAGLGLGLIVDFTLVKHALRGIQKNAEKWLRRREQMPDGNLAAHESRGRQLQKKSCELIRGRGNVKLVG
jgi:hypothetical protein